jgi:hypothetical protein
MISRSLQRPFNELTVGDPRGSDKRGLRRQHSGAWLACLAGVFAALAGGCQSYLLTVEDRVCRVGEKARMVGKIEYHGVFIFNKGLDDRKLFFYIDDKLVGTDESNGEGYAGVKYRCDSPGNHRLFVAYDNDATRRAEASAELFVWPDDDRPIIVVDIDDTLAKSSPLRLVFKSRDRSPPMEDAADVLGELSRHFHIVYLTARPRELFVKTRQWLNQHGFPAGPVLTWDEDKDPWSRTDYKKARIDQLQDEFKHVTIAVGNSSKDHEAYLKRKLFSIIIKPEKVPGPIQHGVRLSGWAEIRELFERNPQLYEKDFSYKTYVKLP